MANRDIEYLRKVYLRAEIAIINEIARLRQRGLIDYHAVAALDRVQKILLSLQDTCWKYIPRMIEREFYVNHPEWYQRAPKSALEHLIGYQNTYNLSAAEYEAARRLTYALLSDIEGASGRIMADLSDYLVGRNVGDIYRSQGLEASLQVKATGMRLQAIENMVDNLRRQGVTAFVDKAGRHWALHNYADMVTRTTVKQAGNAAVLTRDPQQDLYYIPKLGTTCPICAPLEGRVYSKSGSSAVFPPLASAFGKVNENGPNTLDNTWLNIHPNCRHPLIPWTEAGKSPAEIEAIKRFSNPRTNPLTRDPRSQAQIDAYKANQAARQKWLRDFDQYERYRLAIPNKVPKTFQTFQKHKLLNDDKYKAWMKEYRAVVK